MTNIPFRPAVPAPTPVADHATELWNAVMWAYHDGRITAEQGRIAINISMQGFADAYGQWHKIIMGKPPGGPDRRAAVMRP